MSEYAHSMDAADDAIVYFSHHALSLKGLPELQNEKVKSYFHRNDLKVIDDKYRLEQEVQTLIKQAQKPVCLLLMSSGTFDGIDWKNVSSQFR